MSENQNPQTAEQPETAPAAHGKADKRCGSHSVRGKSYFSPFSRFGAIQDDHIFTALRFASRIIFFTDPPEVALALSVMMCADDFMLFAIAS